MPGANTHIGQELPRRFPFISLQVDITDKVVCVLDEFREDVLDPFIGDLGTDVDDMGCQVLGGDILQFGLLLAVGLRSHDEDDSLSLPLSLTRRCKC